MSSMTNDKPLQSRPTPKERVMGSPTAIGPTGLQTD